MKKTLRRLALAICISFVFCSSAFAENDGSINPDWVPPGWKILAEGYILNFSNMGPYVADSFSIKIGAKTLFFCAEAPMSNTETVKRAFSLAMMFYALNQEVAVFGTDDMNAVQIRYRYNR